MRIFETKELLIRDTTKMRLTGREPSYQEKREKEISWKERHFLSIGTQVLGA